MTKHRDQIKVGSVWRERRDPSRLVTVESEPAIWGNDFIVIRGKRRSSIRLYGFLSRYEIVKEQADD